MTARIIAAALLAGAASAGHARANNPQPPPMGWMSWELFRCDINCTAQPTACINEALYEAQTDALVAGGYVAAGYNGIHIDDCSVQMTPGRDPVTHTLQPNATRFPSGFAALGDYMHARGVKFAFYTAENVATCEGYPGSAGYEGLDAATFAAWGVDYLKVDGCGNTTYYPHGYPAMGAALQSTGRPITYSCSWPAYMGDDETAKPWQQILDAGCNLWRNWHDIQCDWESLATIIDHWGTYGQFLAAVAPGGAGYNDADMLLVGNDCISDDEARTQMAVWSIIASPLIMGNDLRNVTASQQAILLNREAIAVNQDPLYSAGFMVVNNNATQVWARNLTDQAVAVALYNRQSGPANNSTDGPADITINFASVGMGSNGGVLVRDLWAQADLGVFNGTYTAVAVPAHGTAFLKLTHA